MWGPKYLSLSYPGQAHSNTMEAVGSIPRRLPGPLSYLEKGTLSATGEYNTSKRKKLNTWAGWQQFVDQTIYTILAQRNVITLTTAFYT